jgi:hypothetical protein
MSFTTILNQSSNLMGGFNMIINLEILRTNLGELNNQLEVLDNKLKSLEKISDNTFFEIYLIANQLNVPLSKSTVHS